MSTSDRRLRVLLRPSERQEHWPAQVEPWTLTDGTSIDAALAGCDVAIIIDRSVVQDIGAADFPDVPRIVDAASAAGVPRLIVLRACNLDAAAAEAIDHAVQKFPGQRLVLRTTPVYGVADDAVSLMLVMMRSLPAVPVLGEGRPMQPLWHEDAAGALAAAVTVRTGDSLVVDIAGPDKLSQSDLHNRISQLIDRRPLKIPVPDFLAEHGARLTEALGLTESVPVSRLVLHTGSDTLVDAADNMLTTLFGITPTSLDSGLRRLVQDLEELPPLEGTGSVEVKRFSVHISDTPHDAASLMRTFRDHFKDVMPVAVGVEPAAPMSTLEPGAVLTMALPGRGHVPVRVEEAAERHVVLATLRGHTLAGMVRFAARDFETGVGFEVLTCDAAANPLDWMALTLVGARLQDGNWRRVVQNVVKLAGGHDQEVQTEGHKLSTEEAEQMQHWIQRIIDERHRREAAAIGAQGYPEHG